MSSTLTYRRDLGIRITVSLLLSLFFVFLGTDSLTDIIRGQYFTADIFASFLLVFIVTSYISLLSAYFDRTYPWNAGAAARVVYQLIAGVLIPSAFVLGYMYLYLVVILGFSRNEVPFFHTEFPIAVLFIFFWNVVYAGYYFYYDSRKSRAEINVLREQLFTLQHVKEAPGIPVETNINGSAAEDDPEPGPYRENKLRILIAVSGNKNIPIPVDSIAYFQKKGNYTSLTTFQSDQYLLNHSLDELAMHLSAAIFFRVNRQVIVNIRACHYFTNEENGKLALHLTPVSDGEVIISQKKAGAFRGWLNQDL